MILINLIMLTSWAVSMIWLISVLMLFVLVVTRPDRQYGALRRVVLETRPFAIPCKVALIVIIQVSGPGWEGWTWPILGLDLLMAIIFRNFPGDDDDDPWKRRKRKAADKVREVAGRLTIVPAAS